MYYLQAYFYCVKYRFPHSNVPNSLQDEVIALLSAAMEEQPEAKGFFLDGFPANVTQAKLCQDMIGKPWKVVVLDLPEAVMVKRLTDGENFNDTDETIKKRIRTYIEETCPLVNAYSDIAIKVISNFVNS